jgi:hypothetical protein
MTYLTIDMKFKRISIALLFAFVLELANLIYPLPANTANLTVAKDTLQSSRMSFSGRIKSPTAALSTHVWIYTAVSGNFTSVSTAGLKPGDGLTIGTHTYTIASIIDDDEFTTTVALQAGDADDGDVIYFKATPQHVITFKTASAVAGGFFQVLIPAASSGFNDNVPDITGFDFNTGVDVNATDVPGTYNFISKVATVSGGTSCPANFHCFEFHYTGAGAIGTDITLTIGNTNGTNTLIAPAPSASRVAATADSYTFKIKNFTNQADPTTATPSDDVTGKVAVIESVRVTATVDPSITFKIEGTSPGSYCSLTTDITTTSDAVPFGVMALDTFKTGAQKLTVSTNAVSGYAVTAVENERLSNLAASPSFIIDTLCDTGACSQTSAAAWATSTAHPGFGYTVAIANGTPTIAPTAPLYQHFPNIAASEAPFQIMSNAGIASSQQAYVCYKLSVDATQPAGNYENQITYTATASF